MATNQGLIKFEIQKWVEGLGSFIRRDGATFFFVKLLVNTDDYKGIGGGNFVIGIAGIITLEFFAGVYSHLTTGCGIWTQSQVERLVKLRKELQDKDYSNSEIGDLLKPVPEVGTMKDAAEAVRAFLQAMKEEKGLDTGLPIEDEDAFDAIWNAFRNNLAHRMIPATGTRLAAVSSGQAQGGVLYPDLFKEDIQLQSEGGDFRLKEDNGTKFWDFQSDSFATGFLVDATRFVIEKVNVCSDYDKLQSALVFVKGIELKSEYRELSHKEMASPQ